MKKLDRLVLFELIGPWVFGVMIFSVLITAGSFLFQLTEYIAGGTNPLIVMQLAALLLPGVVAKTFPMAALLAALLAFGRLSGDSEIVAIKAAGVSVARIVLPVAAFGICVTGLTFALNELAVPVATQNAVSLREEMDKASRDRSSQPTSRAIFEGGRLQAIMAAKNFSFARRSLSGVYLIAFDKDENATFLLRADELIYNSKEDWQIKGKAVLTPVDGGSRTEFLDGVWPRGVAKLDATPNDLLAQTLKNLDALSMAEMGRQVAKEKANPQADPGQVANLEFGYWNKLAVPLGALVFSLVGAPLGIRNHRTGTATGFWQSVIIIFAYFVVVNFMSIFAQGGRISPAVASFAPIVIGLGAAAWFVHRRNN